MQNILNTIEQLFAASGGELCFDSHAAAVRWRHSFYRALKSLRADNPAYDQLVAKLKANSRTVYIVRELPPKIVLANGEDFIEPVPTPTLAEQLGINLEQHDGK